MDARLYSLRCCAPARSASGPSAQTACPSKSPVRACPENPSDRAGGAGQPRPFPRGNQRARDVKASPAQDPAGAVNKTLSGVSW